MSNICIKQLHLIISKDKRFTKESLLTCNMQFMQHKYIKCETDENGELLGDVIEKDTRVYNAMNGHKLYNDYAQGTIILKINNVLSMLATQAYVNKDNNAIVIVLDEIMVTKKIEDDIYGMQVNEFKKLIDCQYTDKQLGLFDKVYVKRNREEGTININPGSIIIPRSNEKFIKTLISINKEINVFTGTSKIALIAI